MANARRGIIILATILGVVLLLFLVPQTNARAQTDTETPVPTFTPTPIYESDVVLTSGNHVVIERRITYGDIAIVAALGILGVIQLVYISIRIPGLWLR